MDYRNNIQKNKKNVFFFLFSLFFITCNAQYSNNITAKISLDFKEDDCGYLCKTARIVVKNNTSNKYYFPFFGLQVKNKLGFSIEKNKYKILKAKIKKKAINNGKILEPICNCTFYSLLYDTTKLPCGFLKNAKKKELDKFRKHNNLAKSDNQIIEKMTSNWVETKYLLNTVLLEPYEECFIYSEYLDVYIKHHDIVKLSAGLKAIKSKNKHLIKNKNSKTDKIEYRYDYYLPEIAGYKLFKGTIKTNTLVIKNGEVIKNKPRNKGRLKNVKTYYY